jgi:hypothetical protein
MRIHALAGFFIFVIFGSAVGAVPAPDGWHLTSGLYKNDTDTVWAPKPTSPIASVHAVPSSNSVLSLLSRMLPTAR